MPFALGGGLAAFGVEESDDGGDVGPPVEGSSGALFPGSGEGVGGVESFVEQVDPAVGDVDRTWPDAGGFPVDESRHGPSVPQQVARVEVAVDELRSSSRTGPWKISIARSQTAGLVAHFGNAYDDWEYTVNGRTPSAASESRSWTSTSTSTSCRIHR